MARSVSEAQVERSADDQSEALAEFYAGNRRAMSQLYEDHFVTVDRAIGRVLQGADKETVIHEVFCRIIADAGLRASFRGGSIRAWIATVARNCAIDHYRRSRRETPAGTCPQPDDSQQVPSFEGCVEARQLISRFREERLPEKWRPVFDVRFVRQLDQSEAARALGMRRTTLLYQEIRIRRLLRRFVLRAEAP